MNHLFFCKSSPMDISNAHRLQMIPFLKQPKQLKQLKQLKQPQKIRPQQMMGMGSHIIRPNIVELSSPQLNAIETYFNNSKFKTHIGVYDTWPTINNAEKEILFRILHACNIISVGVIVITNDGTITGFSNISDDNFKLVKNLNLNQVPKKYIKFVLSMHYASPKTTHHMTLHALWNPTNFMNEHDVHNLKSFDGYLSCQSLLIDNFKNSITDKPIIGVLNHTLSFPLYDVLCDFNNLKCFYVGINWEKLNTDYKPFRQNVLNLLKKLEPFAIVSIYGPRLFSNVNVWEGFTSYKYEIPFDGTSIIHEIKKCGACLVLSSHSHIKFGIASNRLFEGLAAGVPLICDNNPFIKKWFGDNVFYIDINDENCYKQVIECIEFIKNNNEIVIGMLKQCRHIFLTNFLMHEQLQKILNVVS